MSLGVEYSYSEENVHFTDSGSSMPDQIRPDMEEESQFGGYIGGQFDLAAKTVLSVEYVYTGEGSAVGTGLSWKF